MMRRFDRWETVVEILEQMVDWGPKFVALPSAGLALLMVVVKLRKELPFVKDHRGAAAGGCADAPIGWRL